jgi:hypothetical protein
MAGNSERRGAKRNPGSKKGQTVGSGAQRRKQLKGKGPTPKASERPSHPAHRKARAAAKRATSSSGGRSGGTRSQSSNRSREVAGGPEWVAGRNPVVEALRAKVPATALWFAERIDADDRTREAMKLAGQMGIPLMEASRPELDRVAGGAHHQGVTLQVPAYDYAHPDDLLARATEADEAPLLIALDGVTDPRNLGAVLRSAAAFGAHGVVVPTRRAAGVTATAWKVSAGPGLPPHQPDPDAAGLPRGRPVRRGAGRRVDAGHCAGGPRHGAAGARRGLGGQGAVPAGPGELRRGRGDPDLVRRRVPERRCGGRHRAVRGQPPPRGNSGLTLT